ncbi:phosphotransferase family protein [Pseudonocardia kujensis]|uniref:phosphotransferase family protein n=1 Tax=Pseudonocardia kujensis TaxID=1128675 RepID=UPI001E5431AC|nr:phosphotransferase family protein [Pseudonocardia kujensis]MCE0765985.1 phosphotransferase family protein [Pseudonocardia kujensis]
MHSVPTEVSAPPALDPSALAVWLRAQDLDVRGTLRLIRLGDGRSNLTYTVEDEAGQRWVARRPPLGELLASAHDVAREGYVLAALQPTAVPVPEILGLCEDERVASAPVLVMTMVDGATVQEPSDRADLDASIRHEIGRSAAAGLAAVHDVDVAAVELDGLSSHAPYAPRQLRRWSRQWEQSRLRALPALERLTGWLQGNLPVQRETRLLHGDYHLGNLLVDRSSGRLTAVLDWELSTLGDPLADVGSMLGYWPEPDASDAVLPDRRTMAELYARASGHDLADLTYWYVLGLWKIAIIAEGIRRRAGAASPLTAEFVETTVERAHAAISTGI